ncbi:hypothetical protein GCM10027456_38420 [Kineosporia babensis]
MILDGTLIETDRIHTRGLTAGVDRWRSGKHARHGGTIQAVSAPEGWPLWTSNVRPGNKHDTTAARSDAHLLDTEHKALADRLRRRKGRATCSRSRHPRAAAWP